MSRRKRLSPQEAAALKQARRDKLWVRNSAIHREVVDLGHRQVEVARKFNLTQARVSQIVRDIGRQLEQQRKEIGQPLGEPSDRRQKKEADEQFNREMMQSLLIERAESGKPLKTIKTRRDGEGNVLFTEETIREVKPNHQIAKTILKLHEKLRTETSVPPLSPEDEAAAVERGRRLTRLQQETEIEDLETKAAAQAEVRKRREDLKEAQMRAEMGNPRWDEDLSTPERWGYFFARKRLGEVAEGRLSLADAEVLNQQSGGSNGYVYPSYFEICDENINGVRVAKWVRELTPQPSLPTDDEAFLPCYHNLTEWDPHVPRVIEPYPSKIRVDGHNPHRFGRLEVGSACRAEPELPQDADRPLEPEGVGSRPRDVDQPIEVPPGRRDLPESLDVQEERALNDLRRLLYGRGLWAEMADNNVRQLLAEGKSNLYYQGYTREQYQALEAWHRVRQRRKEEEKKALQTA